MKRKERYPRMKTDDVRYGDELQTFKVRCSLETAFYAFVEAHDAKEAEILAENWCEKPDKEDPGRLFWMSKAKYKHQTFEAFEAEEA